MTRVARALAILAAPVIFLAVPANAQSGSTIEVHNMTGSVVTDLRVGASNQDRFEANLIPTSYIYSGGTFRVSVNTRSFGCYYDIRVRYTNGVVHEVHRFDVCSNKHFDLTSKTILAAY